MNINKSLDNIEKENLIWLIYLFIIGANFISNYFEEKFLLTKDPHVIKIVRSINLLVLSIALIIYIYYVYLSYQGIKKNTKNSIFKYLILIASILVLIGGIIYLYVEWNKTVEPELEII